MNLITLSKKGEKSMHILSNISELYALDATGLIPNNFIKYHSNINHEKWFLQKNYSSHQSRK